MNVPFVLLGLLQIVPELLAYLVNQVLVLLLGVLAWNVKVDQLREVVAYANRVRLAMVIQQRSLEPVCLVLLVIVRKKVESVLNVLLVKKPSLEVCVSTVPLDSVQK